ncbi:MAG: RND family transporter [bacterium]
MFRFKQRYQFVYRYYILILIVAVIASIVGGYFTLQLSLESDLAQLLPNSFVSVKAFERIKEEVGGISNLLILLESDNFEAMKDFANDLAPKLLASPIVNYLDYKNDVDFYKKNALLFLETEELDSLQTAIQNKIDAEKQKLNPLFVEDLFGDDVDESADTDLEKWEAKYQDKEPKEYYVNEDSTVLILKVYPKGANTSLNFAQEMIDEVKRIVESAGPLQYDSDMKVYYGGNFKNRLDQYEVVKKDILGTAVYGFGGVFLLIIIYFRRLTGAILITLSLLFSLSWTFGVTYWVIGSLNTITGFLFVILFGLGIDYGIHAFARYAESRRAGLSFEQSIEKLVCHTGKALATTAVTTSAAFFSLTFMDFRGFSDLGFIAGIGMLFALVAMVIVLPAFITLFEKLRLLQIKPVQGRTHNVRPREFRFAKPILLITGFLTLFAIYSFSRVKFEYDFTNLRAITKEREIVGEKRRGIFKLSESPAVVLADSKEEISDIVAAVRKVIEEDTLSPTVKTVRSVFSIVPEDQSARLRKIREIRELIENEAEGVVTGEDKERLDKLMEYLQVDQPFAWNALPEKDKRQFINKKGEIGNFVFIYPSVALRDGRNAIAFRHDIGKVTTAQGKTYYASSSNIILAEMLLVMIREGRLAVILTFLVVFLIVLIDFRSLKSTMFVLTPLAIGVIWMGGVMYLSGMKLNLFNIVVFPSVIGIGVDNGVHIYHRYLEEGRGSLYHVLRNTGLAITMTTLTTIVGYSGLIVARHPGLNSIGKLAVIGLSLAYVTAIVALPALLQSFENRKKKVKSELEVAAQKETYEKV